MTQKVINKCFCNGDKTFKPICAECQCKHTNGWCNTDNQTIFITNKNDVRIGFKNTRYGCQVKLRCNNPSCTAWRNAYFKKDGKLNKLGEISHG